MSRLPAIPDLQEVERAHPPLIPWYGTAGADPGALRGANRGKSVVENGLRERKNT